MLVRSLNYRSEKGKQNNCWALMILLQCLVDDFIAMFRIRGGWVGGGACLVMTFASGIA